MTIHFDAITASACGRRSNRIALTGNPKQVTCKACLTRIALWTRSTTKDV